MKIKLFQLIIIYSLSLNAYAVENIEVQALMGGMVVVLIDGERATIKKNQTSSHGLKLISSTTSSAVIEFNGKQNTYKIGTSISTVYSERESISEQIIIDNYGMFKSYGSINGQSIRLLIDTGATSVAMSAKQARKLGIQYRLKGKPITTSTASGLAKGWRVKLKNVRLGKLVEHNIDGVVLEGDYPSEVLLGMSFLNKMRVEKVLNKMIITQKK